MWGARWPATALDKQILSEVVRSFGEMAGLNGNRPWFEPDWPLSLNRIATGNVLQRQRLTFRPGRTGETVQKVSGAGATPPKTALACAGGPFEEVAPGIFPCRKAGRPVRPPDMPLRTSRGVIQRGDLRGEVPGQPP